MHYDPHSEAVLYCSGIRKNTAVVFIRHVFSEYSQPVVKNMENPPLPVESPHMISSYVLGLSQSAKIATLPYLL